MDIKVNVDYPYKIAVLYGFVKDLGGKLAPKLA